MDGSLQEFDELLGLITLVWRSRFSWGKVLFLVLRYAGLFAHIFNTAGQHFTPFLEICPENLLVYINNTAGPETASSNIILWLVELTLAIAVHQEEVIQFTGVQTTVLLILTVYKTVQTMNGLIGYQKPQMLTLLLRDGVLYFSSVIGNTLYHTVQPVYEFKLYIVVLIVNLLVFHFARPTMATFAAGSNTLGIFELTSYGGTHADRFELDIIFAENHPADLSVTDFEPGSAATLVPDVHLPWA
ncbi:hypothetical protein Clacol_004101 [Clathrus columnatus]|uniref:Uncharacterized protein n=1 Tax=Clathrus columnatus TaxID=1419009 RepID=A0AAV5A887_9AGAM|nr:hypothetical protein Clacol_004101 [Clathrus columnatus]